MLKRSIILFVFQLLLLLQSFATASAQTELDRLNEKAVSLNNNGVKALFVDNYRLAVKYFEESLNLNPSYHLARANLAIAYNNYGLALRDKPNQAIHEFHKAILIDGNNETTRQNLAGIIRMLGRSSSDYKVRLELAEEAQSQKDFVGMAAEYSEALKMHDDDDIRKKMEEALKSVDQLYAQPKRDQSPLEGIGKVST